MLLLKEKTNISHISVDDEQSAKIGKPVGEYITLYCEETDDDQITDDLAQIITEMLFNICDTDKPKYLVAGLGNANITQDSLGVRVAEKVLATAHFAEHPEFDELGLNEVYVFTTRVKAQTGLETVEQLKFISNGISPHCVIVIDSLACNCTERLVKTIQITDTEIFPGSGVGNNRRKISQETLDTPIIAIGVPMVFLPQECEEPVVPHNIDSMLTRFSRVKCD